MVFEYFKDLTQQQREQIEMLTPLYEEWNSKINVVSRKDIDKLQLHHVLHSLAIAKFAQMAGIFTPGTKVIDVGTGGGFPGIPLAILYPQVDFLLVDSIGKKIKVVTEVAAALGLKNVRAVKSRVEDIDEQFDYVVSRAVTDLGNFLP
ncbi:MAG: 16S rRNA (guanine(527)-N(7))-methyltransferase RsmG, partial [Bacteroidales bacterium]|nr:16S rRNA (guanine(527)-N(7))-methyltransferase RsmG [Bacteroidales bacterium]